MPEDEHREFKLTCVEDGQTMQDVGRRLLTSYADGTLPLLFEDVRRLIRGETTELNVIAKLVNWVQWWDRQQAQPDAGEEE
jgi:hypothetical protein